MDGTRSADLVQRIQTAALAAASPTKLSPGNYRFRDAACNNSGVWNEAAASLDFSVAPAYYQTNWFRLLCGAAFLGLLWGLYHLRLRQLARESNMRLDERVSEHTRIARELHDTLLNMTTNKPIRILTVDDHPVLREGIAAILSGEHDMVLVAEASNGREAIEQFRTHHPDVTLMDLQMPVMSGSEAIAAIRKDFPDARIIVLTTYSGDAQAGRAFKAGAYGYLLKSMLRKELAETIRAVHGGRKRMPPEIAVELVEHRAEDALSEREIEVLGQLASGNSNKMIADNLGLSEETIKAHMRNILSKLGANDRTHALAIALKRGIIEI